MFKKTVRMALAMALAAAISLPLLAGCTTEADDSAPLRFSITYSDNPTLPFRQDWLSVTEANRIWNLDVTWEIIPNVDYNTKITSELSTGTNLDVILYRS